MRREFLVLLSSLSLPISAFAAEPAASFPHPRHHPDLDGEFDPEMTGEEYRRAFDEIAAKGKSSLYAGTRLQDVLSLGKRNLDWLATINAARPENRKLELSTPDTQAGIPIEAPKENSETIVRGDFNAMKRDMPAAMLVVLQASTALTPSLPVDDETYLQWARKADKLYQNASRWVMMEPNLWAYAMRSVNDIRGYYFLSKESDLEPKLAGWSQLDLATRARLTPWLVGICHNGGYDKDVCEDLLAAAIRRDGNAFAFYNTHVTKARNKYDGFFVTRKPRPEATWTSASPDLFSAPFKEPADAEVGAWLRDNIEDEWRLGSWRLRLDFRASGAIPKVVFVPGAQPRTNELGGDTITMDANRSIQEYASKWTIRHEFGHVLGLPDCYVEYYDIARGVMINYQVDIENLMCSRRGRILPTHYESLKAAYFRN